MQIDKFSDYALRILMTLAVSAPERRTSASIAQAFGISEHHMSKVATALVRDGYVLSERGRAGGLCLARPADQISIGAVLRSLKKDEPVVECFGADKSCIILPACGLRSPLTAAREAFFAVLDDYSLAEVTTARAKLAQILLPV